MNVIIRPNRTVKIIFAILTFPLVASIAFAYVGDSITNVVINVVLVLPTLLATLIFWLIDRKKKTRLRFYSNYLLLSFFVLSVVIAGASRLFYNAYRMDCQRREASIDGYLSDYKRQFGRLPQNLDDPFFDNAPTGSIVPFIGRYKYYLYSNRKELNAPPPPPERPSYITDNTVVGEASAPSPSVKTEKPKPKILSESYRIEYQSLFGRLRCVGECDNFERENDSWGCESEEFQDLNNKK
jgi:uncharacterized membrane protein